MAKGRQRKGKWYFKNEEEVMKELGLDPTPGSGSGWKNKEDGENDYVLAQLKSTDYESMSIKQLDIQKLEYNAMVANKLPIFIIQFLNNNSRYALVDIEDIPDVAKYIETGKYDKEQEIDVKTFECPKPKLNNPKIKSSKKSREKFFKDKEKAWEERKYKK